MLRVRRRAKDLSLAPPRPLAGRPQQRLRDIASNDNSHSRDHQIYPDHQPKRPGSTDRRVHQSTPARMRSQMPLANTSPISRDYVPRAPAVKPTKSCAHSLRGSRQRLFPGDDSSARPCSGRAATIACFYPVRTQMPQRWKSRSDTAGERGIAQHYEGAPCDLLHRSCLDV
jgi:hypothetical protein